MPAASTAGKPASSRVAPSPASKATLLPGSMRSWRMVTVSGFGFTTWMSTVSVVLREPPSAVTVTWAAPSPAVLRAKRTTLSPALSKWVVSVAAPSVWRAPSALTVTLTSLTLSSRANTFTGSTTSSPAQSCLGRVTRTISGDLTVTVFAALP